jgi:hypothetical protein
VSGLNALRGVGHVRLTLGRCAKAAESFTECVEAARSIGNLNAEMEGCSGSAKSRVATGGLVPHSPTTGRPPRCWQAALSLLTALGIDHAEGAHADDIRTRLAPP